MSLDYPNRADWLRIRDAKVNKARLKPRFVHVSNRWIPDPNWAPGMPAKMILTKGKSAGRGYK